MADSKQTFTTPVGRVVAGSLYKPRTTTIEGGPLVYLHGPKIGQPKVDYFFGLAIAKGAEKTWYETAWGQVILAVGARCFPQAYQSPSFAWKVEDGDSQVPNTKGRKNFDNTDFRGHWILKLGGGYAPKIYQQEGNALPVQVTQEDFIKAGYFVQVVITVDGNQSDLKPGVKLYHSMVCLRAYGQEITFGPDVASAGFGAAPLPAGASAVPLASSVPMPAAPGAPAIPGMPPPPPSVPGVPSPSITAPAPPSVPVTPNLGFLQGAIAAGVPAVPAPPAPIAPPPPAPSPSRTMTAKAGGAPYESYIQGGWTEQQLRDNGMMV